MGVVPAKLLFLQSKNTIKNGNNINDYNRLRDEVSWDTLVLWEEFILDMLET